MDGLVTAQAIGKYERDESLPSSKVLIGLARALDVSVDYLAGDQELVLEAVDFRKKSITSAKEEARVQAQALHLLERYLMVEELLGLPSSEWEAPREAPYPTNELADADRAALHVREAWGLGLDPIPNLVELLEERGIKIASVRLANVDGLMARASRGSKPSVPVVVLNNRSWGERQRFTLAHELGHLLLDVSSKLDGEKAAHRFAGAFLMPAESLWAEIGKHRTSIGWAELFELKQLFGASVQAIVYRCHDLGIFPQKLYQSLFRQMTKEGWRKPPYEEPYAMEPERPVRFFRLCFRALAEGAVSEAKAAELLGLTVRELNQVMDDPTASEILKSLEA
jgi:Zn-dependent peptidase ImmA (M78 family)